MLEVYNFDPPPSKKRVREIAFPDRSSELKSKKFIWNRTINKISAVFTKKTLDVEKFGKMFEHVW